MPSSFPLGAFCANLSSFGSLFPPALFSYSAPPVHSFPLFSWFCLLWCYLFPPLVRSLLLLYLSLSLFLPPSFMFLLPLCFFFQCNRYDPEGPLFLPCLCKGDPPFTCTFPYLFYSILLFFFFLPYFFSLLFSMPSAFTCCQALSVPLDRDVPAPQPHIYLGKSKADDSTGCQCAAPSLSSGWFCVSPAPDRSVKEVGGKEIGGSYCINIAYWPGAAAVPRRALPQPRGVYAAASLHLKEVMGVCRPFHPRVWVCTPHWPVLIGK